jgi:hypothetical protein
MSTSSGEVERLAAACAARLQEVIAADMAALEPDFRALLEAVKRLAPHFNFDRDGRPAAVAAVREALPAVERELLDAIIEDHAAELAAVHEAYFHIVNAARNGS